MTNSGNSPTSATQTETSGASATQTETSGASATQTESGGGGEAPTAPESNVRQPVDNVGYTHSAEGIARVVEHASKLEQVAEGPAFFAGISPHDDYLYAQRVYVHVYPRIRARDVLLIGVAHKARDYPEVEGKLVFDSFDAWHGPYGNVPISPLRQELLDRLPPGDFVVHDKLQSVEHSVEAMVPFLQHYDRNVRIVSILVPYMSWDRTRELASHVSKALTEILGEQKLSLGRDVAVLISSDAVHYGDEGWGEKTFADFGVDPIGYDKAVARDRALVADHLAGKLSLDRLESFYHALVADDFHEYRITWCGRFSIPFGLAVLLDTTADLGLSAPRGELLRYGTTLDPGRSDPGVPGLGVTAPASLRHWVGFAAVGYR